MVERFETRENRSYKFFCGETSGTFVTARGKKSDVVFTKGRDCASLRFIAAPPLLRLLSIFEQWQIRVKTKG